MNERPPPAPASTAGALLRSARERQGVHIAALAAAIKVTPRKLEALENDRHEELADATFIRALAQSVCRTLKIDAAPVLERLPPPLSWASGARSGDLNAPFRGRPGRTEPAWSLATVRPLVWAASLLSVGTLMVYIWPVNGLPGGLFLPGLTAAADVTRSDAPTLSLSAPTGGAGVMTAPALAPIGPSPEAVAAAAVPATTAQPVVETVFLAPPLSFGTTGPASAPAGLVQIGTSEPSWVEVRDGRDQLLLSRTVQPGEIVHLDGPLPIRLLIGNAAATQLGFRGQAVDLAPRTRENIARVELP